MTTQPQNRKKSLLVLLGLIPALLACSLLSSPASAPPQSAPAAAQPAAQPPASTTGGSTAKSIRQWAIKAEASSEYSNPDWAASQATGQPNAVECGDVQTAWAAESQDTREWINLYFENAVYPTEINIVETYYPNQVVQVDLIDMQDKLVTVYTGQPKSVDSPCPYTLTIPVSQNEVLVKGVHITLDQTVIKNWNEIDAVQIVGIPG